MNRTEAHYPVLLSEVLTYLDPQPGHSYLDATLGAGGHARAILERLDSNGMLFGIDQDPVALELAQEKIKPFSQSFRAIQTNFASIPGCLPADYLPLSGGVLADIGVSSMQIDTAERGFSFKQDAPLDMRMSPENLVTAAHIVNTYTEKELVHIFSAYGEEHLSKNIARLLVETRTKQPFETTLQLAGCIVDLYQRKGKSGQKIHPATRVFQALRIEVNQELQVFETFLNKLHQILRPGARVVTITFHSLEDRIVKRFFQQASQHCICPPRLPACRCDHQATFKVITRKPVTASPAEVRENPRSRSAKLRCAERL